MKAALVVLALAATAHADTVTVGLFAPTAPFSSTAARVELATRLGDQLGKALGGTGSGKVYARAADFAAAVRKGDIAIALVDPAYLANAGGGYTVIAVATRGGETAHGWQLVARDPHGSRAPSGDPGPRGAGKLADLKGKRVVVPGIGGRETELVLNVFLGGEVGKDFMKIDTAPDTASALAALGLGKFDAAVVPAGVELPAGTSVVLALPAIPGPVLVAYGTIGADRQAKLTAAAAGFHGDATVTGFRAGDAEAVQAVARRFAVAVKRGPLAVPAVRLLVGDLVEGRTFAIERTPATVFAIRTTDTRH